MFVANDIKRTIRATRAGFAKFCPMPPNKHFTITIATKHPIIAIQYGKFDGMLNAKSTPVTIALLSDIV